MWKGLPESMQLGQWKPLVVLLLCGNHRVKVERFFHAPLNSCHRKEWGPTYKKNPNFPQVNPISYLASCTKGYKLELIDFFRLYWIY